jgi:hypothetical protein
MVQDGTGQPSETKSGLNRTQPELGSIGSRLRPFLENIFLEKFLKKNNFLKKFEKKKSKLASIEINDEILLKVGGIRNFFGENF